MIEETIDILTEDGQMETFISRPERNGPHTAIFLLMDAPGIREELRDMARRLATTGYYVLMPNLYYRSGKNTIFGPDVLYRHAIYTNQDDYTACYERHSSYASVHRKK